MRKQNLWLKRHTHYCQWSPAKLGSVQRKLTSELESVFPNSFPLLENVWIFQIVHNLVNDGLWKTPLHVALLQTTHDICKSKRLITILNRLGLCSNYHDLARIDTGLAKHTIALAGLHRVPIPPSILPGSSIHGAMDNFDHEEHTLSGIGGSYDTILMLFKKNDNPSEDQEVAAFSIKTVLEQKRNYRSLEDIMDWSRLKFANIPIAQQYVALLFQPYLLIGVTLLVHQVNCTVYGYIFVIRRILIEYKTSLLLQRLIVFYFGEGNQVKTLYTNYSISCHRLQHHQYSYGDFSGCLKSKGTWLWSTVVWQWSYRTAKGQQFQNLVQFLFQLIILR